MSEAGILAAGRYRVMVTEGGGGYSEWGPYRLVRWNADPTRDADGWFIYLRDLESGCLWSAGYQPVQAPAERYETHFGENAIELRRDDDGILTRTIIRVAEDEVEWRRLVLINRSARSRTLEVTTYLEVALNLPSADLAHPAFSKLFVETEFLAGHLGGVLLARRRPRSAEDEPLFMGHALLGGEAAMAWETDRARFIGRARSLARPAAMDPSARLSGTVGRVLDPVLVLRSRVTVLPRGTSRLDALLAAANSRQAVERALATAAKPGASGRIFGKDGSAAARVVALPTSFPRHYRPVEGTHRLAPHDEPLRFDNGLGGFSADGSEYVIRMDRTPAGLRLPPLAWTNVIANEMAGCMTSERGVGATWTLNSRQNRLTPWFNDPVVDPAGEAWYLRDEDHRVYWSPLPGPVPGDGAYEVRHGFGYSIWHHTSRSLAQEALCFVPRQAPLRIVRLRVRNLDRASRRLSLFGFVEWVLGSLRATTAQSIVTEPTAEGCAILAVNPARAASHRVAFAAAHGPPSFPCQSTGDRLAFLGRWGSPAVPAAVITPGPLESRFGPGLDPAAACHFAGTLASGASAEWIFLLGEADRRDEADALIERFRAPEAVEVAFGEVRRFWRDLLAAVQVETPSPALDVMVNGWLPYQTLACRLWARSALYQSGGAFGFRDQLQDAAALIYHRPDLTRRQILLHAEHQFVEGDVLHWWHPPRGKGIRTRCSDDSLWLPWAALSYLETTGDLALLGEPARYLAGPPLQEGEAEAPRAPADSGTAGDIYDHCCRAIDRSLPARGRHGLPLMGTGDWNDGMNRVGRLGKGESVWLGLFLLDILPRMIPLCEARGDADRASRYRAVRRDLEKAVNDTGWDGAWYRRAYYDDGTALGSSTSIEARIDALAQAWAVLSGAAPAERVEQALDALERYLVDESAGIIRLLDPPFDYTTSDPGYIKGYLPGVRENGGQYTHAALWVVRALFEAGKSERASVLLEMINPVRHGDSPTAMAEYRVEPYVAAADVYGMAPHLGRGGWTWYTGSAGWMFRVAFESLLGIRLEAGGILVVRPGIPKAWPGFTVRFRLPDRNPPCEIAVQRDNATSVEGAAGWRVDDGAVRIPLAGVGAQRIEVRIGPDVGPSYRPRLSP